MHGRRATNGGNTRLDFDLYFRDYVWFYEVGFDSSLFHSVPRYQKLMDFVKFPPYVTVLLRRQWQRIRRVAPNWLVRSCGVPYSPERSRLLFAENTQK